MTTLFRTNRLRGVGAHISRVVPLLFSAMLMLLLPACESDDKNNSPINTGDDETTITFSVNVPNGFSPTSYGFSKNDEEYLSTVDVLLFNGTTFVSGPHYGVINGSDVTVRIPDTDGTYTMAVFGNCRSTINGKTFAGKSKTTIYGDLTVNNSAKWNTTVTSQVPASPIPMWGEANVTVNDGAVSGTVSVSLVRMLARINVKNGADNFKLTKVFVYNYNKNGRVAPLDGKVSINTGANPPTITVNGFSLPTDPNKETDTANPLEYTVTGGVKNYEFNNEIYLFEADVKTPAANSKPCLVIGGEYSGGSTTYYRIDLADATGGTLSYHDLYRNYSYNVAITNISGAGAANATDAFNTTPINIQYEVTKWNDSDITQVVAGGTTLGVSQGEFNFTKGAANATLTVNTNNADGWTAKVFDSDGTTEKTSDTGFWLQITPKSNNSTGNTDVTLTVAANGSGTRNAFIEITAGTIVYTVKVVQSDSDISLLIDGSVSNKEIILVTPVNEAFSSKSFELSWAPGTSPVYYSGSGSTDYFTFDGATILGGQVLSSSGHKEIYVQSPTFYGGTPTTLAPLVDGATASVSYALYGLSRSVTLKQQVWDMFMLNSAGTNEINDITVSSPVSPAPPSTHLVKLSYPSGAVVGATENNDNIVVDGSAGNGNYSIKVSGLTVSPSNPSTTVSETIKFTAAYESGTIEKQLSFSQEVWDSFITSNDDVNTEITELTLPAVPAGVAPTAQPFKLSYPESPTKVEVTGSGDIAGVGGEGKNRTVTTKTVSAATAGLSKTEPLKTMSYSNAVTVTTTYNGNDVTKQLTIKQPIWDLFILSGAGTGGSVVSSPLVFKDSGGSKGASQTITLSLPTGSSISWSASSGLTNYFALPSDVASSGATRQYSIEPKNVLAMGAATVSGTFTCTVTYDGKSTSKSFTVSQESEPALPTEDPANSYIVNPATSPGIYIPVSQAYKAMNVGVTNGQLPAGWFGDDGNFEAVLVWKDNQSLQFDISMVSGLTGQDAVLYVKPTSGGTVYGNAVIGIVKSGDASNPSGKYLWSWHIWVTNYNPTKGTADQTSMDRNLGALNNSPGNGSLGLYYQWGRKDPFPGPSTTTSTDRIFQPIYDTNGSSIGYREVLTSSLTNNTLAPYNVSYAVNNPDAFLTGSGDWNGTRNDALWGNNATGVGAKTVYDPCPPGWRIPHNGGLTGGRTTSFTASGNGWNWVDGTGNGGHRGYNTTEGNYSYVAAWYPAAGSRSNSGPLSLVGSAGYYWISFVDSALGRLVNFGNSNVLPNLTSNRASGVTVRCVQESSE